MAADNGTIKSNEWFRNLCMDKYLELSDSFQWGNTTADEFLNTMSSVLVLRCLLHRTLIDNLKSVLTCSEFCESTARPLLNPEISDLTRERNESLSVWRGEYYWLNDDWDRFSWGVSRNSTLPETIRYVVCDLIDGFREDDTILEEFEIGLTNLGSQWLTETMLSNFRNNIWGSL